MKINKKCRWTANLLLVMLFIGSAAHAQEAKPAQGAINDETLKKANNPLATVTSVNIQDYIVSNMYGLPDATANQFIVRVAQPIGRVLLRASMPLVTSSSPNQSPVSGFGDFNMFAIYKFPSTSGNEFGIGPSITAPSGSHNLGQGKWQAGISALAFFAKSHVVQSGALLQWQTSFAGDEDRLDVSMLTSQVFFIWQIGGGTYLRSTGVWSFNLENGDYNIPVGLGIGKVVKAGGIVFNIFAEPQFSVLAQGVGQSKFQTFIGFNTQF